MIEEFKNIAKMIGEAGPKLDAAERYGSGAVIIETGVIVCDGNVPKARIFGPYKNAGDAHNYVNIKRERHALSNAAFHGTEGKPPTDDRTFLGHPAFTYRVVPVDGYFAKYLAQILSICTAGLLSGYLVEDNKQPWVAPSGDPGMLDEDDPTFTRPCHECGEQTFEDDLNEMSQCQACDDQ